MNKKNEQDILKDIFTLGHMKYKTLVTYLYYLGILGVLYESTVFGKYISITNTYIKSVNTGDGFYTGQPTINSALGFISGSICFVLLFIAWKIFCELLSLIFNALTIYTMKTNQETSNDTGISSEDIG